MSSMWSSAARWVGMVVVLSALGAAQTYHWRDAHGVRSTRDLGAVPASAQRDVWATATRGRAVAGDEMLLPSGRRVRLLGIDAPDPATAVDAEAPARSRRALEALIGGEELTLRFEKDREDERGRLLAWVFVGETNVNLAQLASGHARAKVMPPNLARADALRLAQAEAKSKRRGLWAPKSLAARTPVSARRAFSLGLYAQDPEHDYGPLLEELKEIGAEQVMLITPWFLDDYRDTVIRPKRGRSASMRCIARTMEKARSLGLHVALMPIVLLWKPPADRWRGNLEARDVDDWFSGYAEFLLPFADVAQELGADLLVIGSEFSSLEKHTDHWRHLIRNVRDRYDGTLAYSANWDHIDTIRFWDDLDVVGMTGYHELTKRNDPSLAELIVRWKEIREELLPVVTRPGKPYLFTELGYASLDGINKTPWDYVTLQHVDLQEQADCYQAWIEAWKDIGGLFRGAYFYTWWRNDDADDVRQYTVKGKPAEEVIRRWFRRP